MVQHILNYDDKESHQIQEGTLYRTKNISATFMKKVDVVRSSEEGLDTTSSPSCWKEGLDADFKSERF